MSFTHGCRNNEIYNVWKDMIQRTSNIKNDGFYGYGARGIKVCDRWLNVANFIEDMYPSYKKGLSIDRINPYGNYEPSNCRWATKSVQARNTRVLQTNNTSGFRGVTFEESRKKFATRITVNHKKIHIGRFLTALEAAKAYDKYVIDNNLEHTINGV